MFLQDDDSEVRKDENAVEENTQAELGRPIKALSFTGKKITICPILEIITY